MSTSVWHIFLLALCVITCVTSKAIEEEAVKEDTDTEKTAEKRDGHYCVVEGRIYQHGALFTYPGFSHCIKYRCNNGGYRPEGKACERNGRCIPVGSTTTDGCRSLRCTEERHGGMYSFKLVPTSQDMCEVAGRCVRKNVPFDHDDCQTYQCVDTPNGGYDFRPMGSAKCKDDSGRCIDVGSTFSKWVSGYLYTNCVCLPRGGYHCSG